MSGKAKRKTPEEEVEALRSATREAHEAIADMTRLVREMRALHTQVQEAAGVVFTERMEHHVAEGLTALSTSMAKGIEDATAAVYRRFDTITSILLGEGHGQTPLASLIEGRG